MMVAGLAMLLVGVVGLVNWAVADLYLRNDERGKTPSRFAIVIFDRNNTVKLRPLWRWTAVVGLPLGAVIFGIGLAIR